MYIEVYDNNNKIVSRSDQYNDSTVSHFSVVPIDEKETPTISLMLFYGHDNQIGELELEVSELMSLDRLRHEDVKVREVGIIHSFIQ